MLEQSTPPSADNSPLENHSWPATGPWECLAWSPSHHITYAACHELGVIWSPYAINCCTLQCYIIKWRWYICDGTIAALKYQKLPEEVAQTPMIPSLPSLSQIHLQPPGKFPKIIWQRKRGLRPALRMVLLDLQAPPESRWWQCCSPSLGHPWRAVVKGSPPKPVKNSSGSMLTECTGHVSTVLKQLVQQSGEMALWRCS